MYENEIIVLDFTAFKRKKVENFKIKSRRRYHTCFHFNRDLINGFDMLSLCALTCTAPLLYTPGAN